MNKEQLIALGLTEEQADKIIEGFGTMIPKTRFDELNESNKQLKEDIKDRDKQLEDLKKIDAEGLQQKIQELQQTNKANQDAYDAKIKQMQIDSAVEKALVGAKAKNIKAVKALLDLENAELDGESIKGLEEQLKTLQESEDSKFLFNIETKNPTQLKGLKPGEKGDTPPGGAQPLSLADAVKSHFTSQE
ncbi:phage scaffolding protein [Bacillus sp. Gen3]|nr:phage scaffolding protein [Bacillus sp. Gen3]